MNDQHYITQYAIITNKLLMRTRFKYIFMGDADDPRCKGAIIRSRKGVWYVLAANDKSTCFTTMKRCKTKKAAMKKIHKEIMRCNYHLITTDKPVHLPGSVYHMWFNCD